MRLEGCLSSQMSYDVKWGSTKDCIQHCKIGLTPSIIKNLLLSESSKSMEQYS